MGTTLTKSRFKIALECPRKLTYATDKKYANTKSEDDFLQGLAEGGHQVGALAKLMYPGGIEITAPTIEEQIQDTQRLLEKDDVILFEPTFRHGNLVIRVDVLVKRGNRIDLIEVKAKGFHPEEDSFRAKRHPIKREWRPYLYDVAFQMLVLERAHPGWAVTPHLMLLDTSAKSSIDGLGSSLPVIRNGRRVTVCIRDDNADTAKGLAVLPCVVSLSYNSVSSAASKASAAFQGKRSEFEEFPRMDNRAHA